MSTKISELVALLAQLRSPNGCPWDRQQTHDTLKPYLLEEAYETLEAIDNHDTSALKEELGDVLLQVIFHAQIAEEHAEFTLDDIATHLSHKLIRRHPHVFQPEQHTEVKTAKDVAQKWETIKKEERQHDGTPPSALNGIPKIAPALQRAYQMQKRASKSGFDWTSSGPVLEKLREECQELYEAVAELQKQQSDTPSHEALSSYESHVEDEFGDVLFSFVNMARFLNINPEESLRKATNRFATRFQHIETKALETGRSIGQCSETELDQWWEDVKLREAQNQQQT
ncbi:nucleoside triphosphate pyrophosphohydrolase [Nitrospira sp. M1]